MNDADILESLSREIETCSRAARPLHIVGGHTKRFHGGVVEGDTISMNHFAGVLEYEPTELVITARAGTRLSDIEQLLARQGQMLAFEPPRLGINSTIGGVVASGLSGPRRGTHGSARDFVLGVTLMDGRGQTLHFGGTVMKNVAGYDVSRLMAGSMGCLGVLLDVSVKVLPMPQTEATLVFDLDAQTAITQFNTWLGRPLPISGTCWWGGTAHVRLSGAPEAVQSAIRLMGGDLLEDAEHELFWNSLRDQRHPFFNWPEDLYRLSLPPTAAHIPTDHDTLIEWAGGQRWLRVPGTVNPRDMQAYARSLNGHATLYHTPDYTKRAHSFTEPDPTVLGIQRKLKREFDPAGIFNPGRMSPIF